MFKGETVYLLKDDEDYVIGVFETEDALDTFMREEYNAEEMIDRYWYNSDEEYEEAIKRANEAVAAKEYHKIDYYIEETMMYKEV